MPLTIVVAGGSGFVGREVVARLVAASHRVVVPTRRRERVRELILLPTVDVVECDIGEIAVRERLLRGADAVVNLVGVLNEAGRDTFQRVHVDFARELAASCVAMRVPRLVHVSAINASADAPSRYLRSKGEAEEAVTAATLDTTIFRPNVIFGRDDALTNLFVRLARLMPVMALGGADARLQPVWVEDVAHCIAQSVADRDSVGRRYELCGPVRYTLAELVRATLAMAGLARPILPLPDAMARALAGVLEHLPGRLLTRDNLASLRVAALCGGAFPAEFGIEPSSLEALAPGWLAPDHARSEFDDWRARVGRR